MSSKVKENTDYNEKKANLERELEKRRGQKKTNNIYFCKGTYMTATDCDIVHGSGVIRLQREDSRAEFRRYINIENEDELFEISIEMCKFFEQIYKVIFPKSIYHSEREYQIIKADFLNSINTVSQKEAVKKVLSYNKTPHRRVFK